jgi:hypothetical protein
MREKHFKHKNCKQNVNEEDMVIKSKNSTSISFYEL